MGQTGLATVFVAAGMAFAAVVHRHRRLKDSSGTGSAVLLSFLSGWAFVAAAGFAALPPGAEKLLAGLSYMCAVFIPPAWVHFLLNQREARGYGSALSVKAIYSAAGLFALCALINPYGLMHEGLRAHRMLGAALNLPALMPTAKVLLCAANALPASYGSKLYTESRASAYGWRRSGLCAASAFGPAALFGLYMAGALPWDFSPLCYFASAVALNWLWGGKLFAGWSFSRGKVFGAVNDGIVLLDGKNRVIDINRVGLEMLDLLASPQPLAEAGKRLAEWCEAAYQSLGGARFVQMFEHSARGARYYRVSGSSFSVGRGVHKNIMVLLQDDTTLYKGEQRAPLGDGLSSRSDFTRALAGEVARCASNAQSNAVICASVANFVSFCNIYGPDFGEQLQREVRLRVQGILRAGDAISRFFDDEFYMSFRYGENAGDVWQNTLRVIRRMNALFDLPVMVGGTAVMVRLRCGVALCPRHSSLAEKLTAMAKMARTRAEKMSQLCVCYDESMGHGMGRRMQIEHGLSTALEHGEMYIVYQPQVDMTTGLVSGVEALLRWNSGTLGNVTPTEFIPIAEETGYIHAIGMWVLRKSAAQAYEWRRQGIKNVKIAVNISLCQLTAENFSDEIIALTHEFGLEPGMLELEVTESVALSPETMAHGHLPRLRQHGVRVALDDFGMGHSSLSYIKAFEVDTIKIDRTLSQDILANPTSAAMIRSLCKLGEDIGAETIVEYVEFREQLDMLEAIGCHLIQGYVFSPPLTADQCTAYVLTSPFRTMLKRAEEGGTVSTS